MVGAVILKDGTRVPADMVVVGVGIRPNTELFKGQLAMQEPGGGLRVNAHLCSVSRSNVYVIGDAAAFPLPLYGNALRRMEHVDHARKSAAAVVDAILSPPHCTPPYDYLPYFYSRVFTLSWQFFGDNLGECVLFGNWSRKASAGSGSNGNSAPSVDSAPGSPPSQSKKFGAYFVDKGRLVGAFLEGGTKEEYAALAEVARRQPRVADKKRLSDLGTEFALREVHDGGVPGTGSRAQGSTSAGGSTDGIVAERSGGGSSPANTATDRMTIQRLSSQGRERPPAPALPPAPPSLLTQASVGVVLAVGITVLAIWHGSYWRKRW